MDLHYLCSSPHVDVYFDKTNKWVFVDWVGDLTLQAVQQACLSIARCFLDQHYPRVPNSNAQVTSVTWEVSAWLASEFLPALSLTGVEQMAWVVPPSLRARNNVLTTVNLFPHCAISLFDDIEQAVAWLQQTVLPPATGPAGPTRFLLDELKLRRIVEAFAQRINPPPTGANTAGK